MIMILLNLLSVAFELVIYYFFLPFFLGCAKFSGKTMALIYLSVGGVSLYLSTAIAVGPLRDIGYFLVILLLALCYKGKVFIKLFLPFLFQCASMMTERCYAITLMPMRSMLEIYGESGENFYYFIGIILSNATIMLLLKFLNSWKNYAFLKKDGVIYSCVFLVLFLFPLSMFYSVDQFYVHVAHSGLITVGSVIVPILLTSVTVLFFFVFDFLVQFIQNRHQLDMLQKQLEDEQQYHRILMEKHQRFQTLRHDTKQHFSILAGLIKNGDRDEALAYAENQAGKLAQLSVVQTGNPLLDAILTLKENQAHQLGAEFQCYVAAKFQTGGIDIDDLASLLSNILNNALEAVALLPKSQPRTIICKMIEEKGYLHISVRNTVAQNIIIKDNYLATTKPDKEHHGFGLVNVQRIAKQYGGIYSLSCSNRLFSAKVLLPIPREVNS